MLSITASYRTEAGKHNLHFYLHHVDCWVISELFCFCLFCLTSASIPCHVSLPHQTCANFLRCLLQITNLAGDETFDDCRVALWTGSRENRCWGKSASKEYSSRDARSGEVPSIYLPCQALHKNLIHPLFNWLPINWVLPNICIVTQSKWIKWNIRLSQCFSVKRTISGSLDWSLLVQMQNERDNLHWKDIFSCTMSQVFWVATRRCQRYCLPENHSGKYWQWGWNPEYRARCCTRPQLIPGPVSLKPVT